MSDRGTLRTTIEVFNYQTPEQTAFVPDAVVDTDSAMTWLPEDVLRDLDIPVEDTKRFVTATGERVERDVGYAIIRVAGEQTIDQVVFAKPGDVIRLGARSLGGLNLKVDPRAKRLVPAGPIPAAAAA
jgi:predicted aspartyl protease